MNERVAHLRKRIFSTEPEICSERAELITQSYKETEGMPMILRRAIALDRILSNMSIYILPGELIVGNQASKDRSAPIFPEYGIDWIEDELEEFSKRKVDKFLVSGQTKEKLKRIFSYWKGKTNYDFNMKLMDLILPEKIARAYDKKNAKLNEVLSNSGRVNTGNGHIIANYKKVINRGLNSIIKKAGDELRKIDGWNGRYEDLDKRLFLKSVIVSCKAAIKFAKRYAQLAKSMAEQEKDPKRKVELEKISEICNHVPENAARNLWEGLQSYWFVHLIIQIEDNGHGISLGRFDQYLYRYYKKDMEAKVLNEEEAKELVECFFLKCNQLNKVRNWHHTRIMHGYPLFQTLVLGGQTRDGEDAVNEFTYLCLRVTGETKLPQPTVVVRVHSKISDKFLVECARILLEHGGGLPAFFNDEVAIPLLTNVGVSLENARDWAVVGCSEPTVPGKTNPITGGTCHINLLKVLELSLNNGINTNNGAQLCPGNGDLATFNSFHEVFEAYKKQLDYYLSFIPTFDYITAKTHAEMTPTPFLSSLIDYRISIGKDVSQGGGPNYNCTLINGYGAPNVGNSLAAIKKLIFEEKLLSKKELKEALQNNFAGQKRERIRQLLLNKAPKYGNDDDYVDLLTRDSLNLFLKGGQKYIPWYGGVYGPSPQTLSANVIMGSVVGATPDGRKAGEPVADNISPTPGTDVKGPTAVLNSVAKIDHTYAVNGTILNLKFHPSALDGDEQIRKFAELIHTYMVDKKGFQVQLNIVSAETLREARKNPDKYRNLVVKVAGYSAFFVTLDRVLQDQIIARTEHVSN